MNRHLPLSRAAITGFSLSPSCDIFLYLKISTGVFATRSLLASSAFLLHLLCICASSPRSVAQQHAEPRAGKGFPALPLAPIGSRHNRNTYTRGKPYEILTPSVADRFIISHDRSSRAALSPKEYSRYKDEDQIIVLVTSWSGSRVLSDRRV